MKKVQWISVIMAIILVSFLTIPAAMAAEKYVEGTVYKSEDGNISLITDPTAERYILESDQDLSEMMGDYVEVTGNLEETPEGQAINITSIERAERPSSGGGGN